MNPAITGVILDADPFLPTGPAKTVRNCKNSPTFFSGGCDGKHSFPYTQKEGGPESVLRNLPERLSISEKTTGVHTPSSGPATNLPFCLPMLPYNLNDTKGVLHRAWG